MQKDKSFDYKGRSNDASASFQSGECAMITQSLAHTAATCVMPNSTGRGAGAAVLPEVRARPTRQPWAAPRSGCSMRQTGSAAEFKGVAKFLDYLKSTPVMTDWAKTIPASHQCRVQISDRRRLLRAKPEDGGRHRHRVWPTAWQGEHTGGYRFGRWTEIRKLPPEGKSRRRCRANSRPKRQSTTASSDAAMLRCGRSRKLLRPTKPPGNGKGALNTPLLLDSIHATPRHLQRKAAALSAAGAAAGGDADFFFWPPDRRSTVGAVAGRVRPVSHLRRPRQLQGSAGRRRVMKTVAHGAFSDSGGGDCTVLALLFAVMAERVIRGAT